MELIGNVNLSNSDDYQSIYASQLYGTFFAVYAKFEVADINPSDGVYKLTGLRLKILNYKGIVNLGIVQGHLLPVENNYNEPKADGWRLILELQALGGSTDCIIQCQSNEFKKGDSFLGVDRRLKELPNMGGFIFDNEFNYREGFKTQVSGDTLVCTQEIITREPKPKKFSDSDLTAKIVFDKNSDSGKQCPKSRLFVM